jgi:hypothetical protein
MAVPLVKDNLLSRSSGYSWRPWGQLAQSFPVVDGGLMRNPPLAITWIWTVCGRAIGGRMPII